MIRNDHVRFLGEGGMVTARPLPDTKNASDQPFLDLGKAYTAFFEGLKNGKKQGRPKFKSKKRSRASFYLANDQFELGDHRIWIPKLGWVNMAESLRLKGGVTDARVT